VIRSIVELLDVADDEPEQIALPVLEKQGEQANLGWWDRFQRAAPDWESWFPLAGDLLSCRHRRHLGERI
jgi:hypothetical protein